MPNDQPRTNLPAGIPDSLKDFIRCKTNEVDLEAGDLDWLPKPDAGGLPVPDVTPGLTFQDGPIPGSVSISVGWGFFGVTITGSIQDGELHVDPPPVPGLGQQITDWVDDLNADLEANGMQLGDLSIRNGKLHFEKQAIPPVTQETAVETPTAAVTVSAAQPATPTTSPPAVSLPTPLPGSKTAAFLDGIKNKAAIGAGALAIGVAAFFIFVDDGPPPVQPTPDAADTATGSPADSNDVAETPSDQSTDGDQSSPEGSGDPEESQTDDPVDEPSGSSDGTEFDPLGAFDNPGLEDFAATVGGGTLVLLQADATGDQDFCGPSDATGADMTGVTVTQDGDMVTVGAALSQLPLVSQGDFSWAVLLRVSFGVHVDRMFLVQIHDGVVTEGEQDAFGATIDGSDVQVTMTEKGVFFTFSILPGDTVQHAAASGFNLRISDDNIGCDQAYGAAGDLPLSPGDTTGGCEAGDTVLCLNDRFSVEVEWNDGSNTGSGGSVGIDGDTGAFWFFAPDNYEMLVRVVNACDFDNHYWVFAAAQTDVEFTLTVTDTATSQVEEFDPLSSSGELILDTTAFATCP